MCSVLFECRVRCTYWRRTGSTLLKLTYCYVRVVLEWSDDEDLDVIEDWSILVMRLLSKGIISRGKLVEMLYESSFSLMNKYWDYFVMNLLPDYIRSPMFLFKIKLSLISTFH